jgi:ribosome maturation factor RimP
MDFSRLLNTTVTGLGYELVGWERSSKGRLVRIFIDKSGGVSVDDCASVSRHLSRLFAVEDVDYDRLEVSSPGLDRVLQKEQDFVRFAGERAHIKLRIGLNGQRNFTGILRTVTGDKLNLEIEGKLVVFELENLEKVRLVPNL